MLDLLSQLPVQYRRDPWVRALLGAVADKDKAQRARADEVTAQILLDALTINLETEERIAGITPSQSATLEDRLSALAAKWRSGGKIDIDQIQRVCDAWRNGEVEVEFTGSTIHLRFVGQYGVPKDMAGLLDAVGDIRPAHLAIAYTIRYLLVREVRTLTVGELQAHTMSEFAV